MAGMFTIVYENPNVVTGGEGCLCAENGCLDNDGPFAAFYAVDMESIVSPTPVLCAGCIVALYNQLTELEPGIEEIVPEV